MDSTGNSQFFTTLDNSILLLLNQMEACLFHRINVRRICNSPKVGPWGGIHESFDFLETLEIPKDKIGGGVKASSKET